MTFDFNILRGLLLLYFTGRLYFKGYRWPIIMPWVLLMTAGLAIETPKLASQLTYYPALLLWVWLIITGGGGGGSGGGRKPKLPKEEKKADWTGAAVPA